jgi:hypothetical protein
VEVRQVKPSQTQDDQQRRGREGQSKKEVRGRKNQFGERERERGEQDDSDK